MSSINSETSVSRETICGCFFTLEFVDNEKEFIKRTFANYIDLLDFAYYLRDLDTPFDARILLYYSDGNIDNKPFKIF